MSESSNPNVIENLRDFKRAKGFAPVNAGGVIGRLLDISRGGMAFSVGDSFDKFTVDAVMQVSLKIPRSKDAPDGLDFHSEGKILSPRMEANGKRMVVGFSFDELSEEARDKLNRVILHFVRSYEPLNRLDEIMTVDKTPKQNPKLKKMDLVNTFNQVLTEYDRLPEDAVKEIERFSEAMGEFLKAVNAGGLN